MGAESFFAEREYQLGHSARFNDDDPAHMHRFPAAAGNRRVFTFSAWVKRGKIGGQQTIFSAYSGNSNLGFNPLVFSSSGQLGLFGESANYLASTALFRDPSAWYHVVLAVNSSDGTANDRIKLYVNGTQITDFATRNNPGDGDQFAVNNAVRHNIGSRTGRANDDYFDGYLADINLIDGLRLGPESFGMTGEFAEEWIPIQYTGAYGTNGFYLNFSGEGTMLATGGTISTDSDYKVHQFTSSGTFTPTIVPGTKAFVQYLVIGGGGGGSGGGGGAGGYKEGFLDVVQGTGLTVTIGAGGALGGAASRDGYQGANSVFSTITAIGGGAAGGGDPAPGNAGGSGGGGGGGNNSVVGGGQNNGGGAGTTGDDASSNQGNNGGYGWTDANSYGIGGGGGGAGAAGSNAAEGGPGGNGGNGVASSITGSSVTRAGGGGGGGATGGGNKNGGSAGSGGAGAGGNNDATGGVATANTGSGGGGGGGSSNGGGGGSGIVILRYKFQ